MRAHLVQRYLGYLHFSDTNWDKAGKVNGTKGQALGTLSLTDVAEHIRVRPHWWHNLRTGGHYETWYWDWTPTYLDRISGICIPENEAFASEIVGFEDCKNLPYR